MEPLPTSPSPSPFAEARLYTFVDTAYLHGRQATDVAQALCDGGSDVIQLRAKGLPQESVLRMAEAILPRIQASRVILVINDHPQVAVKLGGCACHLGQEDFFDAGFHRVEEVPDARIPIGLSSHAPEQAARAVAAGADYVAIGPIYATPTKPEARPVTLDYVRWAAAHVRIPWFAIGGINLQTLEDVLSAGATRICVVSAILNAPDIARACQVFRERLTSAP
jgi:thiamine-phosphate pyrophosphorylase